MHDPGDPAIRPGRREVRRDVQDMHQRALQGARRLWGRTAGSDPQAASENYRTLCDAARTDLADNNAYWAKWEGPVKEAGSTVYTGFLRGYDQTLGMKSYGACVDLLVEYYYPMAQGE